MKSPGKGYSGMLTNISATDYGSVLHSKCKAYLNSELKKNIVLPKEAQSGECSVFEK